MKIPNLEIALAEWGFVAAEAVRTGGEQWTALLIVLSSIISYLILQRQVVGD